MSAGGFYITEHGERVEDEATLRSETREWYGWYEWQRLRKRMDETRAIVDEIHFLDGGR